MWETIVSVFGGNILGGVAEIIKQFNLSPEQAAQVQTSLAQTEAILKSTIEKIAADDRANARQRETAMSIAGQHDLTPKVLAYGTTIGFFGIMASMLYHPLPDQGHDVLLVLVSVLGTSWVAVMSYYFGSSSGSTAKSVLLAEREIKK